MECIQYAGEVWDVVRDIDAQSGNAGSRVFRDGPDIPGNRYDPKIGTECHPFWQLMLFDCLGKRIAVMIKR